MTQRVGLLYDERFLAHRPPHEHPEHPGRLRAIWRRLESADLPARCDRTAARPATRDELSAVHDAQMVDDVLATAGTPIHWIDGDTYACADSAEAARLAAGGLVDLCRAVARGALDSGFALLRPPGHHAERARAMGFCLFNNAAVAAQALLDGGDAQRVVVLDWDLHHGNGTQDIFWEEGRVLYVSTHQHPLYPGTGGLGEVGEGDGEGRTLNVPLPGGLEDADYLDVFDRLIVPVCRAFAPDLVLVSAGFDASAGDPLGAMRVTPAGFAHLTQRLRALAGGKLVLALEGGYNLEAISACAEACLRVLLGEPPGPVELDHVSPISARVVDRALELHRRFWPGL